MRISVVIPTRNRSQSLLRLLRSLEQSEIVPQEVIIVDASDQSLDAEALNSGFRMNIRYLPSEASVCIQRNAGIRAASCDWVFLCDDDIEVPSDYLSKLVSFASQHPDAGAISGLMLQRHEGEWTSAYPVKSARTLWLTYMFCLGIWGPVTVSERTFPTGNLVRYFTGRGNYLSKSGLPVITQLGHTVQQVPVYSLGASLVRRSWLLQSPFDEVLDRNGIGENYGVSLGFPTQGVQLLGGAFVYHHQDESGRPATADRYLKRSLALHYFIVKGRCPRHVRAHWLLWSLAGNGLIFLLQRKHSMAKAAFKALRLILQGANPYVAGAKAGAKLVNPQL